MPSEDDEPDQGVADDAEPGHPSPGGTVGRTARWAAERWPLLITGACALLIVLGILWIVVTGLIARHELNAARGKIDALRHALVEGNTRAAVALTREIADDADDAHQLTTGPAWWVASNIPFVGDPLRTGRVIAVQVDRLCHDVLPRIVRSASTLRSTSLRHGDTIDLTTISAVTPTLDSTAHSVAASLRAVGSVPGSTWLPMANGARHAVLGDLTKLDRELTSTRRIVETVLPMLGEHGPQRYFIGFENEAEARGLGGIAGAFAIAIADHGRLSFTHFGTDADLKGVRADVDLGAQYESLYGGDDPTGIFQNSDVSPDFPSAARIWAGMWAAKTGEHIDGAIAIDPTALAHLLYATGPAHLADGTEVGAGQIVPLTQQQQYSRFPEVTPTAVAERKQFLVSVAKAVSHQLLSASSTTRLLGAVAKSARERRLLIWSADPKLEARLDAGGYSGALDAGDRPFSGFALINSAGSKLDYYLDRSITYRRASCAAGSTATATLTLTNDAPTSGLPPYVTTMLGSKPADMKPGDNKLIVQYYATPGARVTSFRIDGRPVIIASGAENGLTVVRQSIYLRVGATITIEVTTAEPKADGPVQLLVQPAARMANVSVRDTCAAG